MGLQLHRRHSMPIGKLLGEDEGVPREGEGRESEAANKVKIESYEMPHVEDGGATPRFEVALGGGRGGSGSRWALRLPSRSLFRWDCNSIADILCRSESYWEKMKEFLEKEKGAKAKQRTR